MDILTRALNVVAEQGLPVFPVRLCDGACFRCHICKAPATPNGHHDASAEVGRVRELWNKYPGRLVGVPTGKTSGFDVLDLDSAKQPEAVPWWMSNRQRIPHTRIHQTGSGGLHIIFKHNELARTGNNRLGQGIDVKANGGYVVWWPAFGRRVPCDAPVNEWRAKDEGKRLGRPRIAPDLERRILAALSEPGRTEGVRKIAVRFGVDPSTVQRISRPFDGAAAPADGNRSFGADQGSASNG